MFGMSVCFRLTSRSAALDRSAQCTCSTFRALFTAHPHTRLSVQTQDRNKVSITAQGSVTGKACTVPMNRM